MKKNGSFNFGIALKEFRLEKNISQEELALSSELDRTYISMLERNLKTPTLGTIVKLSKSLDISPIQLFAKSFHAEKLNEFSENKSKDKFKPPFFGTSVSCGLPVGHDQIVEKEISLDDYAIKNPKKTIFIKASGESMNPTIWSGDLLVIELTDKAKNNELVLVQINNEFTVKRLFKTPSSIKLTPDNPNFNTINITDNDDFVICGLIRGVIRKFT